MLQYISYLQLCSNMLQNKLSRRQQKYIVNVYKTVQRLRVHFLYDYWLRSVSSYVLRKRNKMPKIKGKYTNHVDLTPLKTPLESLAQSLWRDRAAQPGPAPGGGSTPSPGLRLQPSALPAPQPAGGHCCEGRSPGFSVRGPERNRESYESSRLKLLRR